VIHLPPKGRSLLTPSDKILSTHLIKCENVFRKYMKILNRPVELRNMVNTIEPLLIEYSKLLSYKGKKRKIKRKGDFNRVTKCK